MNQVHCWRTEGRREARGKSFVSLGYSRGDWSEDSRKGGGAERWYFKARLWHRSPQRRRGSGSSQGRVGGATGQPLPGLACWYLQMSSLKCWRSLLLLKRSPERLGSCSGVEREHRGGPFGQTPQLHASARTHPSPSGPTHTHNQNTPTLQYTAGYSPSKTSAP